MAKKKKTVATSSDNDGGPNSGVKPTKVIKKKKAVGAHQATVPKSNSSDDGSRSKKLQKSASKKGASAESQNSKISKKKKKKLAAAAAPPQSVAPDNALSDTAPTVLKKTRGTLPPTTESVTSNKNKTSLGGATKVLSSQSESTIKPKVKPVGGSGPSQGNSVSPDRPVRKEGRPTAQKQGTSTKDLTRGGEQHNETSGVSTGRQNSKRRGLVPESATGKRELSDGTKQEKPLTAGKKGVAPVGMVPGRRPGRGRGRGPGRPSSMINLSGQNRPIGGRTQSGRGGTSRNLGGPKSRSASVHVKSSHNPNHQSNGNTSPTRTLKTSQSARMTPQSILRPSSVHQRPVRAPFLQSPLHDADDSFIEIGEINFDSKRRMGGLKRSSSSDSMGDFSLHSLGTATWHTTRSMLTVDKELEFEDDSQVQTFLRYMKILPPSPTEKPLKRNIRLLTWVTLFLDFVAAMVAITTYDGVTTCCDLPIYDLSDGSQFWDKVVRILTWVYLCMIFLEIIPVIRKGIPLNLLNPFVGFTVTVAMFFDDRVLEAVCMWLIEAGAICSEFLVYRCSSKIYHDKTSRLGAVSDDLNKYSKLKKKRRTPSTDSFSDDDSASSGNSFGEEGDSDDENQQSVAEQSRVSLAGNHKLREVRLLRERRILRQSQREERVHLRYHFVGVIVNFGLIMISMVVIIAIATGGGLCVNSAEKLKVFSRNQISLCPSCIGQENDCNECDLPGGQKQCFYPYYKY